MRKQCSAFWKEIKESARGFAAFAGGHKGVIIVLVLALLLSLIHISCPIM